MKRFLLTVALAGSLAAPAAAQDNHYWTTQFGNRARLLGGAVVGSANDLSALYYDPGALALVTKPELLLSGTVFQYESVGVANALGPGNKLSDSSFALVPSLFAGEIHFAKTQRRQGAKKKWGFLCVFASLRLCVLFPSSIRLANGR